MRKAAVYCFDNQGKMKINLNKLNTDGFFRRQNITESDICCEIDRISNMTSSSNKTK